MKILTRDNVKYTALHLMHANGTTTTLEVKNRLRDLGFHAVQGNVSHHMMDLANETEWPFVDNGQFRTYCLETVEAETVQNTNIGYSANVYTNRQGTTVTTLEDPGDGDWQVSGNGTTLHFGGDYDRDTVRQAYASITGLHFHATRASRIR